MSEIKKTQTLTVKLFGNLGSDPKLLSTHERVYTRPVYDALIDDAVEREFRQPGRELRTFSLAVNAKDEAGNPVTRWHRYVDWQGLTATYRKGDRVSLTGFFKTRTYEKDGETKTVRELVITNAKLERMKVREQAASQAHTRPGTCFWGGHAVSLKTTVIRSRSTCCTTIPN